MLCFPSEGPGPFLPQPGCAFLTLAGSYQLAPDPNGLRGINTEQR